MARQMMPFTETFIAHWTFELLFTLPSICVAGKLTFVMRSHMIHQIAGHAKADIAFGAHILCGQRE